MNQDHRSGIPNTTSICKSCKYFIFYTNVGVAWGYGVWMGDFSSISKKLGWIESQLLLNLDWRCGNSLQIQIVIQSAWTVITVSYFHTMSFLELRLTINIYWNILHSPTKRESNMALCTNPSRTDLLRDIVCIIRFQFQIRTAKETLRIRHSTDTLAIKTTQQGSHAKTTPWWNHQLTCPSSALKGLKEMASHPLPSQLWDHWCSALTPRSCCPSHQVHHGQGNKSKLNPFH